MTALDEATSAEKAEKAAGAGKEGDEEAPKGEAGGPREPGRPSLGWSSPWGAKVREGSRKVRRAAHANAGS